MRREHTGRLLAVAFAMLSLGTAVQADDRVPTGTLRVTYIATNPVQASVDPKTGEVRGPGADMARAIAKRLGVPVKITGVAGPAGVLDSLKKGEADIGLLAFDPERGKGNLFAKPLDNLRSRRKVARCALPQPNPRLEDLRDQDRAGRPRRKTPPSSLATTLGSPPSITATQELVVPRSIPIILAIN